MRVTQGTIYRSTLAQLNRVQNRLHKLNMTAATGKKIQRPSDDPFAIRPLLNARTEIKRSGRFLDTIDTALDRIDILDGHLDHMENVMVRVKEIAIGAVNGSLSLQDKGIYADEVGQLRRELLDAANAQIDGKYLFSGYRGSTPPFAESSDSPNTVVYQGDSGAVEMEIGPGERVRTNLDGASLFLGLEDTDGDGALDPSGTDLFAALANIERALRGKENLVVDAGGQPLPNDAYLDGDPATGIPVLVDAQGLPVQDSAGNQIPLLQPDAQPVRLLQQVDTDGEPVVHPVFGKPVYLYSNGSSVDVDGSGDPVFYDEQGDPHSLLDSGGNPVQMTAIPSLGSQLDLLETGTEQLRRHRSQMGNIGHRLEAAVDHMQEVELDMREVLSRYEDADLIETLTSLTNQEMAFEAALNVSARISKLSILDFI